MTKIISNKRLQISFGDSPFAIREIKNQLTGKNICANGRQALLIRNPLAISEPVFLTELESAHSDDQEFHFIITDESKACRAEIQAGASDDGIRFHLKAVSPQPIWLVEWMLSGLQFDEVIVPALGGQALSKEMPAGTTLSYKYPFWWNAQFVIGASAGGGMWIRTKDAGPNFKMLRVKKEHDGFALTYGFEANAPLVSKTLEATWCLDGYEGSWKTPVDIHRAWLEQAFDLTPLEENACFPRWANDINFVLELWGMRKDRPEPHHTFDQMIECLHQWRKLHEPQRTMVYLPGFAEHGIDSRAPDYNPSKELGGEAKFKQLVDTAHEMGYRVMIHTNVLAMTFTHRLFPKFKEHQVVDLFDRIQGWALDIDGDWLAEPYFAYINPGAKEWGDLMEEVLGELISRFHLDAVFLDQTLLAFNVSKGPDFLVGMRNHITRLAKKFPQVLFAGEGQHEQTLSVLPMAQIHGIDSIAEIHGMEGQARWREAHPVSTYLFGKYTRFTAHLLTKHPSHPMFKLQEAAYAKLGVIPALCLYDHQQTMDLPEVRKMIARVTQAASLTSD
ncbi:hypothetical protein HUU40_02700 [candidate division KSB1 bacterium]|nr:hypothetical protein [candidate division KSB1 bacterium]